MSAMRFIYRSIEILLVFRQYVGHTQGRAIRTHPSLKTGRGGTVFDSISRSVESITGSARQRSRTSWMIMREGRRVIVSGRAGVGTAGAQGKVGAGFGWSKCTRRRQSLNVEQYLEIDVIHMSDCITRSGLNLLDLGPIQCFADDRMSPVFPQEPFILLYQAGMETGSTGGDDPSRPSL
jgi:hypothetical protein